MLSLISHLTNERFLLTLRDGVISTDFVDLHASLLAHLGTLFISLSKLLVVLLLNILQADDRLINDLLLFIKLLFDFFGICLSV